MSDTATAPATKPVSKMTKAELRAHVESLQSQGTHATPATVVEAATAPTVTASDLLKFHVENNGLAFARGGRTVWNVGNLQAAVEVLRTGEPTVVPLEGVGTISKRGVIGMAIGRGDDGQSVITQYVYDPAAKDA